MDKNLPVYWFQYDGKGNRRFIHIRCDTAKMLYKNEYKYTVRELVEQGKWTGGLVNNSHIRESERPSCVKCLNYIHAVSDTERTKTSQPKTCDKCNEYISRETHPYLHKYETYWCECCAEDELRELRNWERERENRLELKYKKSKRDIRFSYPTSITKVKQK